MKIDSSIPLPNTRGTASEDRFPFRSMAIGDSFLLTGQDLRKLNSERTLALRYAGKCGIKATSRSVEGGIRVWRVA